MIEAMIDIETLSVRTNAVVVSIGATVFDGEGRLSNPFFCCLDIDEQIARGRRVDASTLRWWMKQSADAQQASFVDNPVPVAHGLHSMRFSLIASGVRRVWAKGPHFDISKLDDLYDMFGIEPAWKYNEARDTRTYMDLLPPELTPTFRGVAHHPLDDCANQVMQLVEARRFVHSRNELADAFLRRQQEDVREDVALAKGPIDMSTLTHAGKFYP